jgi:dihydrofolate synthase/folylpolyglutamate synthase
MPVAADDPVEWLYSLQQLGIKLGLDNIRALLGCLGHPESAYRKVLVGGTNGKGSVGAMLESILRAWGVRAGMFTSPHLVRPNERIRIDGADVSNDELHRLLNQTRDSIARGIADGVFEAHPSFFETITATALQAFREAGIDVGVLEVGLGGRLDATNATEPDLSVIVTVDLDHTKTLGGTLEQIATEKGGIIKRGRPLVSGVTHVVPRGVLRRICEERDARWIEAHRAARIVDGPDGTFTLETAAGSYPDLRLSLAGRHQRENARVAVVALEELGEILGREPDPAAVARGLATTRWAGRLEWLPGRPGILLDGAHNAAGIATLADYLSRREGPRPILVFSTTREKDLDQVLLPLLRYVDGVVATRSSIARVMEPELVYRYADGKLPMVELHDAPADALAAARSLAGPDGAVLVAGSLYLVGNVLACLEDEPTPGPVPM